MQAQKFIFLQKVFLCLCICVLFTGRSLAATSDDDFEGTFGNNLAWKVSPEGTLTISGNGPMPDYISGESPWHPQRDRITKVIIEEGITTIGNRSFSFYYPSINSVTMPVSVTRIGDDAFEGCTGLTSITIGAGVTEIGHNAFKGCGLTEIVIPDNVLKLANSVFAECKALTSASIGRGLSELPDFMFQLSGLVSVTIPETITKFSADTFHGCDKLETVYYNAVNCADFLTMYVGPPFRDCAALKTIIIGDMVQRIPESVFASVKSLTSVTIGNGVTEIGNNAFSGCTNLAEIIIPDSVQTISYQAFHECTGLTSINLGNGVSEIGVNAFTGAKVKELTIPESVTEFRNGSFGNFSRLETVYFNASNCRNLDVDTPFTDCQILTTIIFGDTVRQIPDYIAEGLLGLESVTLGRRVNQIGQYAFSGCANLMEIINNARRPQTLGWGVFNGVDMSYCITSVPEAALDAYSNSDVWKDFQLEVQE